MSDYGDYGDYYGDEDHGDYWDYFGDEYESDEDYSERPPLIGKPQLDREGRLLQKA